MVFCDERRLTRSGVVNALLIHAARAKKSLKTGCMCLTKMSQLSSIVLAPYEVQSSKA